MSGEENENLLPVEEKKNNSNKLSSLTVFNTAFNVLLGAGPILVPPVFQEPGIALAFIFIILITFISFICSEFVIETMSLLTAIRAKERQEQELQSKLIFPQDSGVKSLSEQTISQDQNNYEITEESFLLKEPIEYSQMGLEIYGKLGQGITATGLVVYLIGVLSSKTIMIGNILSKTFKDVSFLNSTYPWMISFLACSIIFSFSNVQKTKTLQNVIVVVRFLTIAALLIGSFQIAGKTSFHNLNENHTYFDFDNFSSFFGDLQFALLMHHAIPSMFYSIENQKNIKKVSFAAFGIGSLSIVLLSIFGVMAFGKCLDAEKGHNNSECVGLGYATGSSYFNSYFQGIGDADWAFYISSFYIFLNVAAFPVLIITCRNNLMKFLAKDKIPAISYKITKWTIFFTLLIAGPIFAISLTVKNIQIVLDWVSGIFGSMLINLFPSSFVIYARIKAERLGISQDKNIHKSIIKNKYLPYGTFAFGCVLLVYTVYNNFKKYT
ncbi:transmembrane amino acid transporter protein (macronuclear) [Tetrahymena thermophila SB210]|uniref:Transmembrane amino acid transporter protein n=1 Tax=Tetrahymena thermophila (strain SB210) TaxID=312017 RepID=Q24DJ2_TETTS|nr:transmembrane amino acid transporter protein [Tetrahymena thermophila SB210]EAS05856.2 transmembrane amino acid transporter protein [Tetrahymena thermophila SB210]|eukprot:XP_001026101.2 transmembrane amino acid transporter protein [Tetrahymena thermophila SB210]